MAETFRWALPSTVTSFGFVGQRCSCSLRCHINKPARLDSNNTLFTKTRLGLQGYCLLIPSQHYRCDRGTLLPARGVRGTGGVLQWRTSSSEHRGARPLTMTANVIATAAERSWEAALGENTSLFSRLSLPLAQRTGWGQISTCLRVTKEPAGKEIKGCWDVQS